MTNYEKIRAACNKACPELLELTRGCKFRYRCNGKVEYWYGQRYGKRIKSKDSYAKKVVRIRDYEREWREEEVTGISGKSDINVGLWGSCFYNNKGLWYENESYSDGTDYRKFLDLEILGHPPELRHLFRAIGKNERAGDGFRVMTWWGHFFFEGKRQKTEYDLTKPLREQSEEVLEFLASLFSDPEKDDN